MSKSTKLFLLIITMLPGTITAQVPLIKNKGWEISAGSDVWLPLIHKYYDISVISGSDYFWDYYVNPQFSSGITVSASKVMNLYRNGTQGFLSYGGGYQQSLRSFSYSGWEGGGVSGRYEQGIGKKQFTDHCLMAEAKITHQFNFGIRNRVILNSLGINSGFTIYKQEQKSFDGNTQYTNGTTLYNNTGYHRSYWNRDFYKPSLKLNYAFAYVIRFEKFMLMPFVKAPILNFNSYLEKPDLFKQPLELKKEYYKEVVFGISFVAAAQLK